MSDLHTALEAAITARLEVARAAGTRWPEQAAKWRAEPTNAKGVYRVIDGDECWVTGEIPDETVVDHIALHDPADAVRRYERDLRVIRRHTPFDQRNWSPERGSFTEPGCEHCQLTSNDGDPLAREWPCDDYRDVLDVYPEVARDGQ